MEILQTPITNKPTVNWDNYFCRDCNRINLSFDDSKSSYQDDNKFCTCRNKYIEGLPNPKNDEEEFDNPWYDGC